MFVAIRAFNNIITYKLLTACFEVLSDHYQHQIINKFEKLLEQKDEKNILKLTSPIFLTIGMYIGPTRLLEVDLLNAKYYLDGRFCEECTYAN